MLKKERQNHIIEHLKTQGTIYVTQLAEHFEVDPVTIRRDLAELEAQALLHRVHGGAILRKAPKPQIPAEGTSARIAEAAARFIPDKNVVFLGPGPLTLAMAPFLQSRENLTIITNALDVAWAIARQQNHTLHIVGGQVEHDYGIYSTSEALRGARADWVILQVDGLDAERGITHDDQHYSNMARALFALSAQVIILMMPENVGRAGARYIAHAGEMDILITGREAANPPLWDLSELGVRIVLA